ncbi:MAG TPA: response regulator transcription factor [Candidatus Limnocylindria bacterium]|nr:response regulator transcription factor [Candidatus Limnocylindria bacterium]
MVRNRRPAQAGDSIQLVLVDEHPLIRAGVRTMLETEWGMEVVGETDSIDQALAYCRQRRPHVVLMDLDLPAPGLMQGVQRLRRECSDCAVVILAHRDDDEDLYQAVVAGASGHVLDAAQPQHLAMTIRRAAEGGEPIRDVLAGRPSVSQRVMEAFRRLAVYGPPPLAADEPLPLTQRQLTVLRYAAEGLTNRQIARVMGFSEHTIKAEMSAILAELCLKHRTEAVVHAVRRGWISLPEPSGDGPH